MRRYLTICFMLLMVSMPLMVAAQDATTEPTSTPQVERAWLMTDPDAEADSTITESYVVFLSLDDGTTLLEVAGGADLVYTRSDGEHYTGALLIPTDAYDLEDTLEIIDEDTRQATAVVHSGTLTFESHLLYKQTDLEYGLWMEGERDLSEYTMFADCMGRMGVEPPVELANPDPILPIRIDEEAGKLYFGDTVLTGGGGTYELTKEGEFGQFTQVITQTATVSDNLITFSFHAIADGRDDCELRYDTTFVPFDGDYDALFARAEGLST